MKDRFITAFFAMIHLVVILNEVKDLTEN